MSRFLRVLGALVTLLALAGVAALGTLGVMRARDDAFARQNADARDRARAIANVVHDAVQGDLDAVVATNNRPVFHLGVVNKNYPAMGVHIGELGATHPRFASVAIYDRAGRLIVRAPGDPSVAGKLFGQQEYFSQARRAGIHISNLFVQLGRPKVPVIAYSIGIFFHRGLFGVLVATTPIMAFDTLVAPYAPAGSVVRIYNASAERISPSSEASGKTYTTDPVVASVLAGRSSIHRSRSSIVSAAPVADLGWAVVVSQQAGAGDKSVHDLTVRLSYLAGGATLLALIAAAAAWRRKSPRVD